MLHTYLFKHTEYTLDLQDVLFTLDNSMSLYLVQLRHSFLGSFWNR